MLLYCQIPYQSCRVKLQSILSSPACVNFSCSDHVLCTGNAKIYPFRLIILLLGQLLLTRLEVFLVKEGDLLSPYRLLGTCIL